MLSLLPLVLFARAAWPNVHGSSGIVVIPAPTKTTFNDIPQLRASQLKRIRLSTGAEQLAVDLPRSLKFLTFATTNTNGQPPEDLQISVGADPHEDAATGDIVLSLQCAPSYSPEAYRLIIDGANQNAVICASDSAGLYYGFLTLQQLFNDQEGGSCESVTIEDQPRFRWRGFMLDVGRHFQPLDRVLRAIDVMSAYKLNRLHLHLADDQGWRVEISKWPNLTKIGGSTQVGGGAGGFYTKADVRKIVAHAKSRFVMVIPEIDGPGHCNAALASYGELNADGQRKPLYTGTEVGFSSFNVTSPLTYTFLDDVIGELAELFSESTHFHIGGDEAKSTSAVLYKEYIHKVAALVRKNKKIVIGWEEIATAAPIPDPSVSSATDVSSATEGPRILGSGSGMAGPSGSILNRDNRYNNLASRSNASYVSQLWITTGAGDASKPAALALATGGSLILSPASHIYLDMSYAEGEPPGLGLHWAGADEGGYTSVRSAYSWEPATMVGSGWDDALAEGKILGVEAPLWTETVASRMDMDLLMFPRLLGAAEVAWSKQRPVSAASGASSSGNDADAALAAAWAGYEPRLRVHGR
jgi:hexosaminidase